MEDQEVFNSSKSPVFLRLMQKLLTKKTMLMLVEEDPEYTDSSF